MQIKNLKVKNKEFTGYVVINGEECGVSGSFSVSFRGRDQYPIIFIDDLLVLDEAGIDTEDLEQQILDKDDGTWYNDYLDYLAEQRWERMEDK